jgi:hypothetical protein
MRWFRTATLVAAVALAAPVPVRFDRREHRERQERVKDYHLKHGKKVSGKYGRPHFFSGFQVPQRGRRC